MRVIDKEDEEMRTWEGICKKLDKPGRYISRINFGKFRRKFSGILSGIPPLARVRTEESAIQFFLDNKITQDSQEARSMLNTVSNTRVYTGRGYEFVFQKLEDRDGKIAYCATTGAFD